MSDDSDIQVEMNANNKNGKPKSKTVGSSSRYEKFWLKIHKQEPKLSSFITSKLVCIELKLLLEHNMGFAHLLARNNISVVNKIDIVFNQFSTKLRETLMLPKSIIKYCCDNGNYNIDADGRARNAVLVHASNHIWGILFLRWSLSIDGGSNDNSNNNILNFKCTNTDENVSTSICGKGKFFQPLNITNVNLKTDSIHNVMYVQQVHPNYIYSTVNSCSFNENLKHEIGFVWHHFRSFVGGDINHLQNMSGIALNSTHCCLICDITQNEHRDRPTPDNRCWGTRDYTNAVYGDNSNILCAKNHLNSLKGTIKKDSLLGYTKNSLYDIPPLFLSLAILHIREGIVARIFYAMIYEVNTNECPQLTGRQREAMVKDHENLCQLMLDMIKKEEEYLEILGVEKLVEMEQLEQTLDFRELKTKLQQVKFESEQAKKKVQTAINKRKNKNGKKLSKMLMGYHIREFNPVSNSMEGRSASNFVNNWRNFQNFFNHKSNLKLLFCGVMIRLEFIVHGLLTKNTVPYSDEFMETMKQAIIEFDALYKQYLKCIQPDSNRIGFKLHYLYHCWEFSNFFRISGSWIDEQRCEAFNLRLKKYWAIFASAMNHSNLLKMANTMIRHTTSISPQSMLKYIKQSNKLFEQFHAQYYNRSSLLEKEEEEENPIVSSDHRYKTFVAHHGLMS